MISALTSLFLSTRQLTAPRTTHRVIALNELSTHDAHIELRRERCYLRQSNDQVMNVGHVRCLFDLLLCDLLIVESIGDVVSNGEIEENWLLLH